MLVCTNKVECVRNLLAPICFSVSRFDQCQFDHMSQGCSICCYHIISDYLEAAYFMHLMFYHVCNKSMMSYHDRTVKRKLILLTIQQKLYTVIMTYLLHKLPYPLYMQLFFSFYVKCKYFNKSIFIKNVQSYFSIFITFSSLHEHSMTLVCIQSLHI